MADCRIVNAAVDTAVKNIGGDSGEGQDALGGIAQQYKSAGEAFIEALKSAIAPMEGEIKDKLLNFFTVGEESVQKFVTESVPNATKSVAKLLEANRHYFEDSDKQIADSIPSGGGQG